MNAGDIRAGDLVQIKPVTVKEIDALDGVFYAESGGPADQWFWLSDVESIISRAPTPEETIAKLRAENAELRNDVNAAERAFAEISRKYFAAIAKFPPPEPPKDPAPWYPPQQDGYGLWVEGPPPMNLRGGTFEVLYGRERSDKEFRRFGFKASPIYFQSSVAHCIKLEGDQ